MSLRPPLFSIDLHLEVISIPFPNDRLDFEIKFTGWGKEQADSDNRDKKIKKDIGKGERKRNGIRRRK